jgi:conjugative transfer signal peptidase TraF
MNANKTTIIFVSIASFLLLLCGGFFTMGGIVNTGSSIPPGLYWKVEKPLAIGKTVVFCPPNRPEFQEAKTRKYIGTGECPDNFGSMMLRVAAKFKDTITINNSGVYVNDAPYPNSKPLVQDNEGRSMPALTMDHYELKENELLLMSGSVDNPFDSRYFGLITVDQVDSVIKPILP